MKGGDNSSVSIRKNIDNVARDYYGLVKWLL